MIRTAGDGRLKGLYVMGSDPAADILYGEEASEALSKLDFLLVQDYFLTPTAQMAYVVLPQLTFTETKGTFTNTERRVQRFNPAIRTVKDTWDGTEIISHLAFWLGTEFSYASIEEIFKGLAAEVTEYSGLDYARLGDTGVQWEAKTAR